MRALGILVCFCALPAQSQTVPAAGTITAVPPSARLDEDNDGVVDDADASNDDGLCGLFVKANRSAFPSTIAQAVGLLDGPADRFVPDPAFHELVPFVDVDDRNATVITPFSQSLTAPWVDADITCTANDASGGGGSVPQFEGAAFRLRGSLHIERPGTKTLLLNSDDGFRVQIGGVTVLAFDGNRQPTVDSRRVRFDAAGVYTVEIVYWEQGGNAVHELFFADDEVTFTSVDTNDAVLGASGSDLTRAVVPTTVPRFFQTFGVPLVGRPRWDLALTCDDRVGEPSAVCVADDGDACGNRVVDQTSAGAESCDDGNTITGDGCSALCAIEVGSACRGVPSVCGLDPDDDGVPSVLEIELGTDVNDADSDDDGDDDGAEIGVNHLRPLDGDGDGQLDARESALSDSDSDGVVDELDVANDDPCVPDPAAAACVAEGEGEEGEGEEGEGEDGGEGEEGEGEGGEGETPPGRGDVLPLDLSVSGGGALSTCGSAGSGAPGIVLVLVLLGRRRQRGRQPS